MMNKIAAKCRICRRIGERLFLRGERCVSTKCPLHRRNYPPGIHGQKRQAAPTEYGLQAREAKKAKALYGITQRQLRNYYLAALRKKGASSEMLGQLLERRFDNVIFRLGLASSRPQARQFINHGLFLVNQRRMDIPSYSVRTGDTISFAEKTKTKKIYQTIQDSVNQQKISSWLSWDKENSIGKVVSLPAEKELPQNINLRLIIAFYAR